MTLYTCGMVALEPCIFSSAAETTRGLRRKLNEDAAAIRETQGLFVVCDGMGGQRDGAVASRMAAQLLLDHFGAHGTPSNIASAGSRLVAAIEAANDAVYCAGHAPRAGRPLQPMGTTVVALLLAHGHAIVAHAGDSRCYRMRGRTLARLTRDHRVENDPDLARRLDAQRPGFSREHGKLLTRSLGNQYRLAPEVRVAVLQPHDRFLLCTDGLTAVLRDREIAAILLEYREPDEAARALVRAADQAGRSDDLTVVLASRRLPT